MSCILISSSRGGKYDVVPNKTDETREKTARTARNISRRRIQDSKGMLESVMPLARHDVMVYIMIGRESTSDLKQIRYSMVSETQWQWLGYAC